MQATYTETFTTQSGQVIPGAHKTIDLPFSRVSARAIVVRRSDGALIGVVHHRNARCALPGGGVDDGESAQQAVARELREENVTLLGSDEGWRERVAVDYFPGYGELAVWYVFVVDGAEIGPCEETVEARWVRQDEDVWHPLVRERILLALQRFAPDLVRQRVVVEGQPPPR
jgi:8-oxo-dGTP pyrophosphatase MutT (NUDIX family)